MDEEQEELAARGFWFDEKGKIQGFNANVFAQFIQDNYEFIYAEDKNWYQYQDGVWVEID